MSPACEACERRVRCPIAVPFSANSCRIVKWCAASGFLLAYVLMLIATRQAVDNHIASDIGIFFLIRVSLISALFAVTMWACNHVIACAGKGGVPESRLAK